MGRSRRKGKKQTINFTREDPGSGEEEKIPAKRRGRPLKALKNDTQEKEVTEKVEEVDDGENPKGILSEKNIETQGVLENGRKRRRTSQINGNHETIKEENSMETKIHTNDSLKHGGFRQNGSRRKSKPHRAAEVGVECK